MKQFLFLLIFFFLLQHIFAQATNFTVEEIDSIVKKIDFNCISGGIVDYEFHKKGQKKKVIGGGADWFYTDTSGKVLLKVNKEISLASENMDIYYFYKDSLIFLKTSSATYIDGKKKINWQGVYYFQNSQLIFKDDDLKFVFKPESYLKTAKQFFDSDQIWRRRR